MRFAALIVMLTGCYGSCPEVTEAEPIVSGTYALDEQWVDDEVFAEHFGARAGAVTLTLDVEAGTATMSFPSEEGLVVHAWALGEIDDGGF